MPHAQPASSCRVFEHVLSSTQQTLRCRPASQRSRRHASQHSLHIAWCRLQRDAHVGLGRAPGSALTVVQAQGDAATRGPAAYLPFGAGAGAGACASTSKGASHSLATFAPFCQAHESRRGCGMYRCRGRWSTRGHAQQPSSRHSHKRMDFSKRGSAEMPNAP